ncbi:amino acid ABC transporter permease [Herbiconiux moechotypicola]|uniref:Amino acid ABC transporter permease n=1 Tax=Herbiconiux moechotypicola TaxID=637393 RepID=A0ABN3DZS8_9MICO|nr:amino acid ABC transporter permease [Herbiconiux moechotypicola]MCS5731129.1 amino acid ABC transporter permease [Herbiconiux moechotypicola]
MTDSPAEAAVGREGARPLLLRETKLNVVPVRHWGRGVLAVVSVVILASVVMGLWTNPNIEWPIVWEFVFSPAILKGLWSTLQISAVSMVVALILAVVIAVMRISPSRIVSGFAAAYVFIFRGIPMIVLLIFVGNLGLFFQDFAIGIPFTDITFWSVPVKDVMSPFLASVIGLSLAGSGYMAEIVRGGLLSIGRGQHEAAKALGLNRTRTLRYIVMPQALKVLLPPMGNEFISMLKASAIVSVIAGGDLLTVALGISGVNFRTIELLIVASIWYLLVIAVLTVVQYFVEKRTAER